jgi:predicted ATPase
MHKAHELAEQMLRLAQSSHDPALLLEAYRALGTSLVLLGELRQGQKHLEQGIALYDSQKHRSHAFLYGIDPGVYCLCFAAWNLWCLGYPDQTLKNTQDALRLAHELAHPHTLAFALNLTTYFYQFCHEGTDVREQAEACLTLSTEHGFAYRVAVATIMRGWALAAAGQLEEGVVQMQEGLAAQRVTGSGIVHPYYLALQAEISGKMGQPEKGLTALAEASALRQRTGEGWYEAELYRLKGELTPERKIAGVARGDEPSPSVAAPGQEARGSPAVNRDLQLVHRGL